MAFRIRSSRLAARQVRNESRWWRRHRTKAPNLFRDELRRAFALIAEYPDAGPTTDDVDLPGLRRVLLVGTQHYIYYRVNAAERRIEILAIWSTSHGEPPPIDAG